MGVLVGRGFVGGTGSLALSSIFTELCGMGGVCVCGYVSEGEGGGMDLVYSSIFPGLFEVGSVVRVWMCCGFGAEFITLSLPPCPILFVSPCSACSCVCVCVCCVAPSKPPSALWTSKPPSSSLPADCVQDQ